MGGGCLEGVADRCWRYRTHRYASAPYSDASAAKTLAGLCSNIVSIMLIQGLARNWRGHLKTNKHQQNILRLSARVWRLCCRAKRCSRSLSAPTCCLKLNPLSGSRAGIQQLLQTRRVRCFARNCLCNQYRSESACLLARSCPPTLTRRGSRLVAHALIQLPNSGGE